MARICLDEGDGEFNGWELSEFEVEVLDLVFSVEFAVEVGHDTQVHHMEHVSELVG